ncbi:PEP-CTERM sorting domain-containing protein [Gammaproteobacteria bacterium]|nr:PEP-CTERM sorting domain-containing protein [Gammaproteobacteria bacterium]
MALNWTPPTSDVIWNGPGISLGCNDRAGSGLDGASLCNTFAQWTSVSPVPVPAAIWLFGTGIIGLIGFSKRRKAA